MVVKKQLRKISKKIMILGLATSIIFTSCFSTKKIDAHATSVAAGLGAYTLYEICLYIGSIALPLLGIGAIYENRDDIAEFGKFVIDSITDLPEEGWLFGSNFAESSYVYGSEALQEVQETSWEVIQGGGQSPKNDDDNDGDGDKDSDDRTIELNLTGFFLLEAGKNLFVNTLKPLYEKWVNKDYENPLEGVLGSPDGAFFNGYVQNEAGKYLIEIYSQSHYLLFVSSEPLAVIYTYTSDGNPAVSLCTVNSATYDFYLDGNLKRENHPIGSTQGVHVLYSDSFPRTDFINMTSNAPIFSTKENAQNFLRTLDESDILNKQKCFRIADWLADESYWQGLLEDLALSLRSLQGLSDLALEFTRNAFRNKPTVNIAGDTLNEYMTYTYAPITNVYITQPTYYPITNTTPHLDISVFPNFDITINPDSGGGTQPPDDGDGDDNSGDNNSNFDIDLPTLSIMFDIIYLMVMIVVMLLFVFLACLGFIVMIFRIPASSSMLPEDMVLGFEHLKTIMIPGFNISIFDFAMALIYLFIVFTVIKIIRLEINDYGIPKSRKGG